MSAGAISGLLVALGFIVVHDALISDIWFNAGPMLSTGLLCGSCVVWSYRSTVARQSITAWARYAGVYVTEMIALGAVSLVVLDPRFTMAGLMVADDAFDRLLSPSMPLMAGAIVAGTILIWIYYGRRRRALLPILATQTLLVFLLGHQFAFLGLVETSSALLLVFLEFSAIVVGLAIVFCLGVVWLTMTLERIETWRRRER